MNLARALPLYRGLSVPADQAEAVRTAILRDGLRGGEGSWRIELNDLRPRIESLLGQPDLTTEATRPSVWVKTAGGGHRRLIDGFPTVCAADPLGAAYYARVHDGAARPGRAGLVVEFEAPIGEVYVDGRDFLYSAFQFWDQVTAGRRSAQRRILCRSYGKAVGRYFDRACASTEQSYRIAMCDLGCQDPEVVEAHAAAQVVLGGRYGTVFRSAFHVRLPVSSGRIRAVSPATALDFTPKLTHLGFRAPAGLNQSLPRAPLRDRHRRFESGSHQEAVGGQSSE